MASEILQTYGNEIRLDGNDIAVREEGNEIFRKGMKKKIFVCCFGIPAKKKYLLAHFGTKRSGFSRCNGHFQTSFSIILVQRNSTNNRNS